MKQVNEEPAKRGRRTLAESTRMALMAKDLIVAGEAVASAAQAAGFKDADAYLRTARMLGWEETPETRTGMREVLRAEELAGKRITYVPDAEPEVLPDPDPPYVPDDEPAAMPDDEPPYTPDPEPERMQEPRGLRINRLNGAQWCYEINSAGDVRMNRAGRNERAITLKMHEIPEITREMLEVYRLMGGKGA